MKIDPKNVTEGVKVLSELPDGGLRLLVPKEGGGIYIPELRESDARYMSFYLTILEDHSMAFHLNLYEAGQTDETFKLRFGILDHMKSFVCVDTEWLKGNLLFPEPMEGTLKFVCHGSRIDRKKIDVAMLGALPSFHDMTVEISAIEFTDEYPEREALPDVKLVDAFGQNKTREWPEKIHSKEELKSRMNALLDTVQDGYPFENWSKFGGFKEKKLGEGTGFFTKKKADGRWCLVDPEGYAFLSYGCDCVRNYVDSRIDGVEKWLDWLPENEGVWSQFFDDEKEVRHNGRRQMRSFNYMAANLYRVFGDAWQEKWLKLFSGLLRANGFNTVGNWSDELLYGGASQMAYVDRLENFPTTTTRIFRDFPDVFAPEYAENAAVCAQALTARKDDPWMIGYFLRNEPAWAFVDNLVIADEVLYNEEKTVCKEKLIAELQEKYGTVEALNAAWHTAFAGFEDLYKRQEKASAYSEQAAGDLRAFSKKMIQAYVEIPSQACRKADPNHMILGMRWAWISDPDLATGWENFDVFSINCYAVDPTAAIQHVADLGVDLPVMIGEFHFGALDKGLTATGLEAVRTQTERGIAISHYFEKAAAHPYGTGAHYFQCNDQFLLGRFDGENYNIGIFDVCCQPYQEMLDPIRESAEKIYQIADGKVAANEKTAEEIPMIAY